MIIIVPGNVAYSENSIFEANTRKCLQPFLSNICETISPK